jgi:hypothetical protein
VGTSVPDWPTECPGVDSSGRTFAVMSFGAEAAPVAQRWCAGTSGPTWRWHGDSATAEALALLADETSKARVGWRLMLAGPEIDVLRACAVAENGGALASEIVGFVVESRRRRVRCAHCGTTTDAESVTVECVGCGRRLRVEAHVSRRHAAYLGVEAVEAG